MNKIDKIIQGMQTANPPSDYWITSDIKFPELKASQLVIHPINGQSVFDHTMSVIDLLAIKNPITLLSGLFHDLGKCCVKSIDNSKFPCHAIKSVNIARMRLAEWQASPYLIDQIIRIVLTHMYDIVTATKEKTIQKFVANVGSDNIENWFTVRRADSASYSKNNRYQRHIIDPFYQIVKKYLNQLPPKNDSLQLQSRPNIVVRGKECKSGDTFLSTKGK